MTADVVTVVMTERVSYELTLTTGRLAALLGITEAQLAARLDDPSTWSEQNGPGGSNNPVLLDLIDDDTHRIGAEDREWRVR